MKRKIKTTIIKREDILGIGEFDYELDIKGYHRVIIILAMAMVSGIAEKFLIFRR